MSNWLFYRLSPGGPGRMDAAIGGPVRRAARILRDDAGCESWFFLRYLDDRGPHVRLRVRAVDRDGGDRLAELLEADLHPALEELAGREPHERRPLLPTPKRLALGRGEHLGLEHDVYEPEWRKYGGAEGVAIAEELFRVSSNVVLAVDGERLGSADRAALALTLMTAAGDAALPLDERQEFWRRYAGWWTGEQRGLQHGARLAAIVGRAADQVGATLRRAATVMWGAGRVRAAADLYAWGIQSMLGEARARRVRLGVPHLAFHHIHMTNNRLGMTLIEEALLAAVLARSGSEETQQ